jgi:aspartyl protease family protein
MAGVSAVTFGPSELAQLMREMQTTIAIVLLSSVCAGIVFGSLIAARAIVRAKQQRTRPDPPIFEATRAGAGDSIAPAQSVMAPVARVLDQIATLQVQDRPPPEPDRLYFPFAVTIVLAIGAGAFYWYPTSSAPPAAPRTPMASEFSSAPPAAPRTPKASEFESVYSQLGIQPLPPNVERQQQVQSRLDQLNREPCFTDAMVGLGRALLDAGYPRETATSLRTFAKRCGNAREVLPLGYHALERINDFSGALEVANELVEALPANGTFRYWRAKAYGRTRQFPLTIVDYMNTVQLIEPQKSIFGDVFYEWAQSYAAIGRYCDAISPIEMYVSLDPANRRTAQTVKIISDYAEQGRCDKRYATGTTRVSFVGSPNVRTLTVVINGVAGNLILDTGATFVSITSQFARKANVAAEPANQVIMKTVGGKTIAEIGYAKSVSVGKAEALGVVTAVHREDNNPFGIRVDGLLGMSFLSRFNVKLSPTAIELTAIPLR